MAPNKVRHARQRRAQLAEETLGILERGAYTNGDRRSVSIAESLDRAIAGTRTIRPEDTPRWRSEACPNPQITVANETTLVAAQRLVSVGRDVVILNFASAKNPGGGFRTGSQAQEESLARSSGLYACVSDSVMYTTNRRAKNPIYSEHLIYSPGVPFFRDDDGSLLAEPWRCAVVTAPAVNAGVARKRGASRTKINRVMRSRMRRVLTLAASHGHDTIVLGAWGCGVFRNDPVEVASLFAEALDGDLRGAFALAHFAVYDTLDGRFISAFRQHLG